MRLGDREKKIGRKFTSKQNKKMIICYFKSNDYKFVRAQFGSFVGVSRASIQLLFRISPTLLLDLKICELKNNLACNISSSASRVQWN